MTLGILINSIGLTLSVITLNPLFTLGSILIFSFGEMAFSPKILEYISRIAPADKAALYMGTQFLPMALGNFLGGFIAGGIYNQLADKFHLIRKMLPDIDPLNIMTNDQLFLSASEFLNTNKAGLNKILWETCHPGRFGLVLTGIGIFTVILLYVYDRLLVIHNNRISEKTKNSREK